MIERLVLFRTNVLRDRLPPLFCVVEYRINIEDDATEWKYPVADDLADAEFCEASVHNAHMIHGSSDWNMNVRLQGSFTSVRLPVVEWSCEGSREERRRRRRQC